jgi:hypothetical protein
LFRPNRIRGLECSGVATGAANVLQRTNQATSLAAPHRVGSGLQQIECLENYLTIVRPAARLAEARDAGAANSQDAGSASKPLQPPSADTPIIMKVITQMESEDGWVPLAEVGKQLANLASDFDPRTFGLRKLGDLVRRTNSFEIEQPKGGSMRIRTKSAAGSPPKSKTVTKTAT